MSSSTRDSRPDTSKSWLHQLKFLKRGFPQSLPGANYAGFPVEGHIFYILVHLLAMGVMDTAKIISIITGKSERTVRGWRATFLVNDGTFPESLIGKYKRNGVLWQNEDLNKQATKYVRGNNSVKGKPNMTLYSFCHSVNDSLLQSCVLEPGKIGLETARTWLHELGFSKIIAKKGNYVDGHEREDVVEYKNKFLRKMVSLGFLQ